MSFLGIKKVTKHKCEVIYYTSEATEYTSEIIEYTSEIIEFTSEVIKCAGHEVFINIGT